MQRMSLPLAQSERESAEKSRKDASISTRAIEGLFAFVLVIDRARPRYGPDALSRSRFVMVDRLCLAQRPFLGCCALGPQPRIVLNDGQLGFVHPRGISQHKSILTTPSLPMSWKTNRAICPEALKRVTIHFCPVHFSTRRPASSSGQSPPQGPCKTLPPSRALPEGRQSWRVRSPCPE